MFWVIIKTIPFLNKVENSWSLVVFEIFRVNKAWNLKYQMLEREKSGKFIKFNLDPFSNFNRTEQILWTQLFLKLLLHHIATAIHENSTKALYFKLNFICTLVFLDIVFSAQFLSIKRNEQQEIWTTDNCLILYYFIPALPLPT